MNVRRRRPGGQEHFRPRRRSRLSRSWWPFIIPALVAVIAINGLPLIYSFYLSLRNQNLAFPDRNSFAGLANYGEIFTSELIRQSTINTAIYVTVSVALSIVFGLALALLVDKIDKGKRLYRTAFFIPMLIAPAVIGIMWRFLLNDQAGPITWLLTTMGLDHSPLTDPRFALLAVTLVDVWQWTPFVFLLLLAGLEAAPQEPLEAAAVDGANPWQTFRHIKLPSLVPLIIVAVLFRSTWAFRAFDQPYTMTQGGPARATELLALSVFRFGFEDLRVGAAAALAMLMVVVMAIFAGFVVKTQSDR